MPTSTSYEPQTDADVGFPEHEAATAAPKTAASGARRVTPIAPFLFCSAALLQLGQDELRDRLEGVEHAHTRASDSLEVRHVGGVEHLAKLLEAGHVGEVPLV